jgi:hypothetical protein
LRAYFQVYDSSAKRNNTAFFKKHLQMATVAGQLKSCPNRVKEPPQQADTPF